MSFNHNATWQEQSSTPDTPGSGKVKLYPKADGWYWVDDAGTEHGPIAEVEAAVVLAGDMWPTVTAGAAAAAVHEFATNDVNVRHLAFDQTTQEHAQFIWWTPNGWDAGTVTYQVIWTASGGTPAQNVQWNLQGRAFADDDAIDQAFGTAVEVQDDLNAVGDMHVTAQSAALTIAGTPVAGEPVVFQVFRDAAGDSLADDALLLGIKINYGVA